jgi:Zn-finger nucleic acid-binding protein
MNRQNFGRKSGIIVDVCRGHGIWFDLGELPRVLAWIQHGGEQQVHQLQVEEARAAERQRRLDEGMPPAAGGGWPERAEPDLLENLVDLLEGGVRQLFHRH